MLGAACVDAKAAGCLLISLSRLLRHHRAKNQDDLVEGQVRLSKRVGLWSTRVRYFGRHAK